jgi:hypothetical protein
MATILNLEDNNVDVFEMTTTEVRALDVTSDLDIGEQLDLAFDEAQGKTFTGDHEVSYLVIKITKG